MGAKVRISAILSSYSRSDLPRLGRAILGAVPIFLVRSPGSQAGATTCHTEREQTNISSFCVLKGHIWGVGEPAETRRRV